VRTAGNTPYNYLVDVFAALDDETMHAKDTVEFRM
jgi:hypothetical protein